MEDEDIIFDFNKLKGRIKEKVGTQAILAEKIGFAEATLSKKLNNVFEFTSKDIIKIAKELDIINVNDYFFTLKVQETEQK